MDDLRVPTIEELVMMSPAQVEIGAHELEFQRRRFEAASAVLMLRVDTCGAFLADGHRRIAAWGRATNNWSTPESNRMAKLARAFKALPKFATACMEGRIGVAQMHAVAAVVANPRVKNWLADADELFATSAEELEFDDLSVMLRHWEELADQDGARSKYDKAVSARDAAIRFVGEKAYLDAQGPAHDGVLFEQVLNHFIDIEWRTEWDILAAVHGDDMHPSLMERTHAQRRFDALQRLFAAAGKAAGSGADGRGALVNILIDQRTWEHELERLLGGDPDPIDPSHAPDRRCQDADGHLLDARAVVAAAMVGQVRRLVIGADGVPLDMGRKQRLFRGPSARPYCWPTATAPTPAASSPVAAAKPTTSNRTPNRARPRSPTVGRRAGSTTPSRTTATAPSETPEATTSPSEPTAPRSAGPSFSYTPHTSDPTASPASHANPSDHHPELGPLSSEEA